MNEPDWENCREKEFWSYIAWHLEKAGIGSVLVGGAVVAIYTEGLYQSKDIDLVPDDLERERLDEVLRRIGFLATKGRHYRHPKCGHLYVEFPPGPVSLGEDDRVDPDEIEVEGQALKLLSPTDCVRDRLASYIHWGVRDCFDQAVLVSRRQAGRVDLESVRAWCVHEGSAATFEKLERSIEADER